MKKITLAVSAPLDPDFLPSVLWDRQYVSVAKASGTAVPLRLGLERENGLCSFFETMVRPDADAETIRYVERLVKFLLWSRGGWKLEISGPRLIGERIAWIYSARGKRKFDCKMMGLAYGKKFQVVIGKGARVSRGSELETSAGGNLKGCRVGFDLGASDYKVSAVIDGKAVFTEEIPWTPSKANDPEYHYHHISAGLHRAAAHLPRVDAIGGSSAGIIVDNEIRVASLLRSVPKKDFRRAATVFKRVQQDWEVPILVMNDGDVTALAGALSLGRKDMLGIAMGSSEAAGFLNKQGGVTGWLNELAFAPVDHNPEAVSDEWSGDKGVGALYLSQQAVNKLLPAARIKLPADMGLPDRLKEVQRLVAKGDQRAVRIYETIGVYFGYALAHYKTFYDFANVLVVGRVTTGKGGDVLVGKAREVLAREFPEMAGGITLHVPDEKTRRVGQAVAAASLPALRG